MVVTLERNTCWHLLYLLRRDGALSNPAPSVTACLGLPSGLAAAGCACPAGLETDDFLAVLFPRLETETVNERTETWGNADN